MTCHSTRERLEAYLDGELPPADTAHMRAHLLACPACAALETHERAVLQRIRSAVRAIEVPSWLGARVGAALAVEVAMPRDGAP